MTTLRSTLSRDEKAVLAYARRLGLPVAILILEREIRRPRDDAPSGVTPQARQLDTGGRTGEAIKAGGAE